MAQYKLLLPKMGESVAEATIIKWNKNPGDHIEMDDTVMEIATDKVDSEVPSPVSGKLVEQLYKVDDVAQVGSVIAIIETAEPQSSNGQHPAESKDEARQDKNIEKDPEQPTESVPYTAQLEKKSAADTETSFKSGSRFYSPLVRNIAAREGVSIAELDHIPGKGAEGRLTKDDLLSYLQNKQHTDASAPANHEAGQAGQVKQQPSQAAPTASLSGGDEIIE